MAVVRLVRSDWISNVEIRRSATGGPCGTSANYLGPMDAASRPRRTAKSQVGLRQFGDAVRLPGNFPNRSSIQRKCAPFHRNEDRQKPDSAAAGIRLGFRA